MVNFPSNQLFANQMKKSIITSIVFLALSLTSNSFAEEWFTRKSAKDFKYVNMFIENISTANYVIIVGDVPNPTGQSCNCRFRLKSEGHKQEFKSFLEKLNIRERQSPPESNSKGNIRYVEYSINVVSVFDDHRKYCTFSGPPLLASLSSEQSFWIDSNFDEDEFYDFLKKTGSQCDEVKYSGNPPQYIPSVILGSWHTEDNEVEIEFLEDGTFRFLNAPMSFCTHLNNVPHKYKIFHLIGETSKWKISDDLLSLSFIMAPPLDNGTTGIWISRLDSEYLYFRCRDNSTLRFIRSKNKANQ